jgi:acyl dehydratase
VHDIRKVADQAMIDRWGSLSGDLNPLHVDPRYAETTRYGGTILHGHMTVAWLMECALAQWGAGWLAAGTLHAVRFLQPLRPDVEYVVTAAEVADVDDVVTLAVLLPDGTPAVTTTAILRNENRG